MELAAAKKIRLIFYYSIESLTTALSSWDFIRFLKDLFWTELLDRRFSSDIIFLLRSSTELVN